MATVWATADVKKVEILRGQGRFGPQEDCWEGRRFLRPNGDGCKQTTVVTEHHLRFPNGLSHSMKEIKAFNTYLNVCCSVYVFHSISLADCHTDDC